MGNRDKSWQLDYGLVSDDDTHVGHLLLSPGDEFIDGQVRQSPAAERNNCSPLSGPSWPCALPRNPTPHQLYNWNAERNPSEADRSISYRFTQASLATQFLHSAAVLVYQNMTNHLRHAAYPV